MTDKTKIIVVPKEHIEKARIFSDILNRYDAKCTEVKKAFDQEMNNVHETFKVEAHLAWVELAQIIGIDAAASWSNPEYFLDRTYLDHDFAAVRYTPREDNPYQKIFGAMGEEYDGSEPITDDKSVDKSKLN